MSPLETQPQHKAAAAARRLHLLLLPRLAACFLSPPAGCTSRLLLLGMPVNVRQRHAETAAAAAACSAACTSPLLRRRRGRQLAAFGAASGSNMAAGEGLAS